MSIDLSQFIGTFLEESYEGLDVMESSLLNFDAGDEEIINTIFRAAHSIKGGAGTFGFNEVAEFTHSVETLLDEMRSQKQEASTPLLNLLLESVDCIKSLLEATQDGPEADAEIINQVQGRLQLALGQETVASELPLEPVGQSVPAIPESVSSQVIWNIHFIPNSDVLHSGHEPSFMFEALTELGSLKVEVITTTLGKLSELKPEDLYLSWKLSLESDCEEIDIREIFEWIEDECELNITQVQADSEQSAVGWQIGFIPQGEILKTGNEPSLMFSALAELGDLTVTAVTEKLPYLVNLSADELFLSWHMRLESDCSKEQVLEIFEWVEDACELQISALTDAAKNTLSDAATEVKRSQTISAKPAVAIDKTASAEPANSKASSSAPRKAKAPVEATSIRVDTDKIDALINRVGELVITQAMLGQVGDDIGEIIEGPEVERLQTGLELLERNTRDLQEDVMRVRMLRTSVVADVNVLSMIGARLLASTSLRVTCVT